MSNANPGDATPTSQQPRPLTAEAAREDLDGLRRHIELQRDMPLHSDLGFRSRVFWGLLVDARREAGKYEGLGVQPPPLFTNPEITNIVDLECRHDRLLEWLGAQVARFGGPIPYEVLQARLIRALGANPDLPSETLASDEAEGRKVDQEAEVDAAEVECAEALGPLPFEGEVTARGEREPAAGLSGQLGREHTPYHSPDFSSVVCPLGIFSFSQTQRPVVIALWHEWERGSAGLSEGYLLKASGAVSTRLRDLFKSSRAWGKLIVKASQKDMFRLALDPPGKN
jgi:hypothetical protein